MTAIPTILQFVSSLDTSSTTLIPDLRARITLFPLNTKLTPPQRYTLEIKGTELWNSSTRLNRNDDASTGEKLAACLLRVFAFGMLDTAAQMRHQKQKKDEAIMRILKAAFKCLRLCLDCDELEFAGKIAQRAAWWLDEEGLDEEAWKQDKLDVAEMMYAKFLKIEWRQDTESAESLADTLYEIGKDLYDKRHYELAVRWLERSLHALEEQELDRMSDDAGELRLATMQKLAKSLLAIKSPESLEQARNIIQLVDHDYGDKLISSLLRLELLAEDLEPASEEYYNVLQRMIRTIVMTLGNFKTLMHHMHKLKKLSPNLACKALDDLISLRLVKDVREEWVERACMMRIWIMTSSHLKEDVHFLKDILNVMYSNNDKPFSAAAAHAAQTLLWKYIDSAYNEQRYEAAERYCELALHKLFQKAGDLNKAKIFRKSIMCSLSRGEDAGARQRFFDMPEPQQNTPESRLLAYKVAIRTRDTDLAAECLDSVSRSSVKDASYLYACVLVAQQMGERKQALTALMKVFARYDHGSAGKIQLPALLRCIVRMLQKEVDSLDMPDDEAMDTICELFEATVKHAKDKPQEFTPVELEWFSKNSYNLALKSCTIAHPQHLHRLAVACARLIESLQRDTPLIERTDLRIRHIIVEYLAMSAIVVLARAEDNNETHLKNYLAVTKHARSVRNLIAEQMGIDSLSQAVQSDMISKHIQSVKFSLEAILHLGKWDEINGMFSECWTYDDPKRWDTLADLGLAINEEICTKGFEIIKLHQPKVLKFMQRVIQKSSEKNEGVEKLARWIRCLFSIALPKDEKLALHCLNQAISVAERTRKTRTPFPYTELEWLATTAYNHAVSLYCANDDVNCQIWAEKALTLAGAADDNAELSTLLTRNYAKLRWNVRDG